MVMKMLLTASYNNNWLSAYKSDYLMCLTNVFVL